MNQPPNPDPPPQWRRPAGVAPGTWDYFHQRSIADHYDAFVADTPLCRLDVSFLSECFPGPGVGEHQTILDLGCGSGRIAVALARAGYDVIGIDLSAAMLELMMTKSTAYRGAAGGSVSGVRANLVELDCFSGGSADHAVCLFSTLGMIQGRQHRRRMLAHVARILRPGGRMVVHVHNRWAALREPAGIGRLTRSWLASLVGDRAEFGDSTYSYRGISRMFLHRFSKHELIRDLVVTGWRVERVQALSIDGSQTIRGGPLCTLRAGGYLAVAVRPG